MPSNWKSQRLTIEKRIAQMKKPARARSGSPAVNVPPLLGPPAVASQPEPPSVGGIIYNYNPAAAAAAAAKVGNPFAHLADTSNSSNNANKSNFSFGQSQEQANGSRPFQFGMSAPAPAPPQQNGQSQPSTNGEWTVSHEAFYNPCPDTPMQEEEQFHSGNYLQEQVAEAARAKALAAVREIQAYNFPAPEQQTPSTTFGGFGATQQQTPSTSFGGFGSTQETSSTSFGGFGATQQQTPSTTFGGFGATPQQTSNNNPFGGFGATQDKPQENTSFGGFGAAQQSNDASRASTPFSGFGATQPEKPNNTFGGFGQQQQPAASEQPSTLFGQSQTNGNQSSTLFGQPQTNGTQSSTLFGQSQANGDQSSNSFSGFGAQQQPEPSTTSFAGFGQNNMQASEKQSTPSFTFGQTNGTQPQQTQSTTAPSNMFGQTNGTQPSQTQSTAAPSNMFGGFGSAQTNGASASTPSFTFGQSQPAASSQPEQPTSNIFPQSAQPSGEKKGLFGSTLAPAGVSPGTGSVFDNLPKKDLSNGGKPLFNSSQVYRPEEDDEEDANNEENGSSTNVFGQSQQKPSMFATSQANQFTPKPTTSFFNSVNQTPSMGASQQDTSMSTPSSNTNIFGSANQQTAEPAAQAKSTPAPGRSLFDRIDKDDVAKRLGQQEDSDKSVETPRASLLNNTAPETPATAKPLFASTAGTSSMFSKPADATEAQAPSESLFQKPASQTSTTTPVTPAPPAAPAVSFKAPPATAPAARMAPPPSRAAVTTTLTSTNNLSASQKKKMKQLNNGLIAHLNGQDAEQDWTAVFQYYMKMASQICGSQLPAEATAPIAQSAAGPEVPATGNLFSRATASNSSELTPKPPANTGLFSKPPSTAPPASKKRSLEQDDDSATQPPATEKRSKPYEPVNYPKLPETSSSTSRLFEAALDKSKSSDASASSVFNPSTKPMFSASQTTAPKASSGGFMPTSTPAAGGTNFLASFGKAARANEEKERKKRKAEDYDSDDETEEAWEKRDREEQEAKRAKLAEAAKTGSGFSFSASNDAPKTPAFKLGSGSVASTTPAVPPPKFSGLFGSVSKQQTTSSMSEAGKLAPPTGFGFGPASSSVEASRATTPGGVTTDGEASTAADDAGEPSDEPNMDQGDDPNALQPAELEANELLQEIPNGLTRKFSKKEGEEKSSFQTQGEGRVYVLKDKTTGKTRILSRVGMGKLILNFNPLKNFSYTVHAKKTNLVVCDFLDHINYSPPRPDRFYITTGSADEAKELARLLTEGTTQ